MPSWIRSRNGQPLVAVALGDRDDEAEVGLDHRLLGGVVAELDPLRELDLLRRGEERHLADVLEEELQRVGRDLRLGGPLLLGVGLALLGADDVDLRLFERGVELVELGRIEVELVEREGDLLGVELAGALAGLEQRPHLEQVEDARGDGGLRGAG